ncbi:MAG: hypothetical protein J6K28_08710 [Alistipes sp.]|nr:hypothetical protein [Alistipes sp.]
MRYFIRSVKFLLALAVLYAAVMWIMVKTGSTMLSARDMVAVMFLTVRGRILIAAVVVWAAIYPKVGFVSRRVEADITDDRERIVNAFLSAGYTLVGDDGECLRFRAAGLLRKLRLLFEDEVTVSQYGQWVVIEGIRRSVADAEMRLKTYMNNKRRDERDS